MGAQSASAPVNFPTGFRMEYYRLSIPIPKRPWLWIRYRIVTILLLVAILWKWKSPRFARRTALVIWNERTGLTDDILAQLDDVVEIPVWGLPHSYNVATATAMCLYEYCRQFPDG